MSGYEIMTLGEVYEALKNRPDGCRGIPGHPDCILPDLADRSGTNEYLCVGSQCSVLMTALNELRRQTESSSS